jgi:hypothetical protein
VTSTSASKKRISPLSIYDEQSLNLALVLLGDETMENRGMIHREWERFPNEFISEGGGTRLVPRTEDGGKPINQKTLFRSRINVGGYLTIMPTICLMEGRGT